MRRVAGGIYSRTFGAVGSYFYSAPQEDEEESMEESYICIDYLNRQVDSLVRWANKYDKKVLTMAQIKNYIRKSTNNTEEEIALLLKQAEHSGKMVVEKLQESQESEDGVMCKFSASDNQNAEETVIS